MSNKKSTKRIDEVITITTEDLHIEYELIVVEDNEEIPTTPKKVVNITELGQKIANFGVKVVELVDKAKDLFQS